MEYISIIQPLILIAVSLSIGAFFGSLWMFFIMHKTENNLRKKLDSTNKLLDSYTNKYDDDNYEAY